MKKRFFSFVLPAVPFLACLTGCEIDSADRAVRITPSSADVGYGQSVQLRAEGGYFYTWSMENNEWGRFNNTHGATVVYTSLYSPSNETSALQTITVVSRYTDSAAPNVPTNGAHYVDSAEAYIRHVH